MSENAAVSILVSGRVQGVGYRFFVVDAAEVLGLYGWVTNLSNGKVEAFAEGPKESLERLIEACKSGPPASRVESVDAAFAEFEGKYRDFRIR